MATVRTLRITKKQRDDYFDKLKSVNQLLTDTRNELETYKAQLDTESQSAIIASIDNAAKEIDELTAMHKSLFGML